jgi:hypothetical protein
MILSCDPNQVISILKANFGRESHDVCIIDKNITVTCQSSSALQIMQTYCDNKESCSAMASYPDGPRKSDVFLVVGRNKQKI